MGFAATYKGKWPVQLFTIYLRYLIGAAFVFASIVKIQGLRFTSQGGENMPINSAWHFFETLYQSGLYWQFLGWGQFVAGALLLTQRFAKLGAVIFMPISLNIFIITLSYYFNYTPVVTGGLVLANLYLLLWDWGTLRVLVGLPPIIEHNSQLENRAVWAYTGMLILMFTCSYRLFTEHYNILLWITVCALITLLGTVLAFAQKLKV